MTVLLCFSLILGNATSISFGILLFNHHNEKPAPPKQAKSEWKSIRKEPDKSKGKVVVWKAKVTFNFETEVHANLEGDWHCGIELCVFTRNLMGDVYRLTWSEAVERSWVPRIVRDDWIVFTGTFIQVENSGDLLFEIRKVNNLGP